MYSMLYEFSMGIVSQIEKTYKITKKKKCFVKLLLLNNHNHNMRMLYLVNNSL